MPILGWKWPWEAAPKTPEAVIKTIISEPAIIPAAAPLAVVTKSILKIGGVGALIAGGAGFLAGSLLGGGGTQTVSPKQPTVTAPKLVTPLTQMLDLQQRLRDIQAEQRAKAEAKAVVPIVVKPQVVPTTTYRDISAGRDIEIGGISTVTTTPTTTTTITHAGITQETIGQLSQLLQAAKQEPQQITIVTPTQTTEAKQEQSSWIIAAAIIAAALLFGGKK